MLHQVWLYLRKWPYELPQARKGFSSRRGRKREHDVFGCSAQ